MSEPIKPFAWLVIDKEDGCEYGNMHPDYGRDCCHEHIKDAQETGIPHARRWVVREVFSREQVEQATAELRAECDALRAEVEELDQLRNRMSELLTATAEALRGPPAPQSLHDWSSIPDRTAAVVNALCGAMELAIEQCAERDALKATIRHLCEETRRIEAERDALRADAGRYRHVIAHARRIVICGVELERTNMDQLSARIDAAREAK